MATTNTVSETRPGCLVYSFTALASGDTFDFGFVGDADTIEFQITAGTFGTGPAIVALTGSIAGTTFLPMVEPVGGNTFSLQAVSGDRLITPYVPNFLRLTCTTSGSAASGIACQVCIRRKVGV